MNKHEDPIEGEEPIYDSLPGWPFYVLLALAALALVLLCGCSTPRDPWQKWQEENPAQVWDFDSATGQWRVR